MKFRTDFVTNSSDTGFVVFNVKNKALFKRLTSLGIRFEKTKKGRFSDRMRIVLPSGASENFLSCDTWAFPYVDNYESISAWIVATLLWEIEYVCNDYPPDDDDEHSAFTMELIDLLNNANITHFDWEADEDREIDRMMEDISAAFDQMDDDLEEAEIEQTYGFEGDVGPCIYIEAHDGQRLRVKYYNNSKIETEDCEGLKFSVAGKLKYFKNREAITAAIEKMGGSVVERVSRNTDYLICNDIKSGFSNLEKAKSIGISVLTELAFIRRFCDVDKFDGIKDENEIGNDSWELTTEGEVLDFVVENGTQPIVMEVWKDGKWQINESEQKTALKNAAMSAIREEAKSIMSKIFEEDSGAILKKLLLVKTRDCLNAENSSLSQITDVSFDELCTKGTVRFERGAIDSLEEKDCFIILEIKKYNKDSSDIIDFLAFTTICRHSMCDLDGYKNRVLEISSFIIDAINGKEMDGVGKILYATSISKTIPNEYASHTLMFSVVDKFSSLQPEKNILKGYDIDNTAIAEVLLQTPSLMKMMGLENVSAGDIYANGHFRTYRSFSPGNGNDYTSWLIFGLPTHKRLTITPVSRDRKLLADIIAVLREKLSGLSVPIRGELSYSNDDSEDEIELSDEIYCGEIVLSHNAFSR